MWQRREKDPPMPNGGQFEVRQVATLLSLIAAIFAGFLQLSGWFLVPLAALAVYGMQSYNSKQVVRQRSYVWQFIVAFLVLAAAEWVARLMSLYLSGHQFIQR